MAASALHEARMILSRHLSESTALRPSPSQMRSKMPRHGRHRLPVHGPIGSADRQRLDGHPGHPRAYGGRAEVGTHQGRRLPGRVSSGREPPVGWIAPPFPLSTSRRNSESATPTTPLPIPCPRVTRATARAYRANRAPVRALRVPLTLERAENRPTSRNSTT